MTVPVFQFHKPTIAAEIPEAETTTGFSALGLVAGKLRRLSSTAFDTVLTHAAQAIADIDLRKAQIEAIISANIPGHEWLGRSLRLRNPDGGWGEPVDLGSALQIGTVETVAAGEPAEVTITGAGPLQTINFKLPPGDGDVVGPGSAAAGEIAIYADVTGREIAGGGKSLADLATRDQGRRADAVATIDGDGAFASFTPAAKAAIDAAVVASPAVVGITGWVYGMFGGLVLPQTAQWLDYLQLFALPMPRRVVTFAVDDFIAALVDCGAWGKLDFINVFFLADELTALRSLKGSLARVQWANPNGLEFQPGIGFQGNAIGQLTTATYAGQLANYSRNSATLGVMVSGGGLTTNTNEISTADGASDPGLGLNSWGGGSTQTVRVNNSEALVAAVPSPEGLVIGVRESATRLVSYRDGVMIGESDASPSQAVSTSPLRLLGSGTGRSEDRIHAAFAGSALSVDEVYGVHAALATLRSTIGVF